MSKQLGAITKEGEIVLSNKEKGILLSKLNRWNEDGLQRIKFKLKKWRVIRNYIHGADWGLRGSGVTGGAVTAAQRLVGGFSMSGNPDDEPYVNNVMMRIHMSNMQRIGRYKPHIEVEPEDSSRLNKQAARRGEIFLHDLMDKQKFATRLERKIDRIICLTGAVYTKCMIDPSAGDERSAPILDNFGQVSGYEELDDVEGDISVDVLPPKNLVLPPYCTDLDEADYIIENNVRTTAYALRRYNTVLKPEDISTEDAEWWRSGIGDDRSANTPAADKKEGLCIIKEAFVRRSEEFPMGAHVIWSQDEVMKSTTLDDHYPDLPYAKAEFIYDDEDIDGETPYWFMIPMQNALNRVESDIKSHEQLMSKPKWQQHIETQLVDPDGITNRTAQILKWSGSVPPGIIQAPELPDTIFKWRDMVLGEMMSLGAAHDIVRPSQPRSGTAIAYEQEQDDTTLAPTIGSIGAMHERWMGFALKLKSQYINTPRKYSFRNPKGLLISDTFGGDDLRGNFKVRVNMQSGLPANKIARQQLIIQLTNQGIISAEKAQRYFEFGEVDEALQKMLVSYERAQKLVELLEAGGSYSEMKAQIFDNHDVMLEELRTAMQERWEDWHPGIQDQFGLAYADHEKARQERMMGMMRMQMLAGGTGATGGAPGPDGKPGSGVPAAAPMAPPGVPDSGQGPGQQPDKPTDNSSSLFEIPGMADLASPAMAGG